MSFFEVVEQTQTFLERNGRISLRALQRGFELDRSATGSTACEQRKRAELELARCLFEEMCLTQPVRAVDDALAS